MTTNADRWSPALDAYRPAIKAISREKFRKIPGFSQDDLESELYEVLWLACQKYDPDKGAKFNTFFRMLVNNRIARLLRDAFALKRQSNVFTETLEDDAVRQAIENRSIQPSAEEEFFARLTVREHKPVRRGRR